MDLIREIVDDFFNILLTCC